MILIGLVLQGIPLAEVKADGSNPSTDVALVWQHAARIVKWGFCGLIHLICITVADLSFSPQVWQIWLWNVETGESRRYMSCTYLSQ